MQDLFDKIFKRHGSPEKCKDLSIPLRLSKSLKFPEKAYPTVHIAGTNGKGSTATKIAKALEFSGLRVGLYTSPHILRYNERISINGEEISDDEVVKGLKLLLAFEEEEATFFDLTTLLAFDYFREKKVDVAVIETGLGGRLDATNIVEPHLTVITSISCDHVAILGNSSDLIGREKAGILKWRVPIVLGPSARTASILMQAEKLEAPLIFVDGSFSFYDEENQAIGRACLDHLKAHFPLSQEAIDKGILARPPCRFEEKNGVIFDVAHNPDGFSKFIRALEYFYPKKPVFALIAMCKDKDYKASLQQMSLCAEKIYLTQADSSRALDPLEMQKALFAQNFHHTEVGPLETLFMKARKEAHERGALLAICGTFLIMHSAKTQLQSSERF